MMSIWAQWQSVGIAAVAMVLTLVGLVYAIGVGFNMPKVKAWARNEFYQALASAIILGGMIILVPSINGMVYGLAGPVPFGCANPNSCGRDLSKGCDFTSPGIPLLGIGAVDNYVCKEGCGGYSVAFDHALCLIDIIKLALTQVYTTLAGISLVVGTVLSYKMNVAFAQSGYGFAFAPGLFMMMDAIGIVMMFIGAGTVSLWAQGFILYFIRFNITALLPIGIALRSFPFTRGAGAAMISLVVGLYVVFPLLMVLERVMVINDILEYDWVPSLDWTDFASLGTTYMVKILVNIFDFAVYLVLVVGILFPVLNFTLTFAFMKDFARLLGGEIDVSSLAKLL